MSMDDDRLLNPKPLFPHELRLVNPFIKPQWRYDRAAHIITHSLKLSRYDDQFVKAAVRFLRTWTADTTGSRREKLMSENPALTIAYRLWAEEELYPDKKLMLEARLLSGQNDAAIATAMHSLEEVPHWYSRLFFDIRGKLRCVDWIMSEILFPAAERAGQRLRMPLPSESPTLENVRRVPTIVQPYLDFTILFFAYFGGPVVCEFMLTGFNRGAQISNVSDLDDYLDQALRLQVKRRAAQAAGVFEINRYSVGQLIDTHVRIMELQKASGDGEGSSTARTQGMLNLVQMMLEELPWTAGPASVDVHSGTLLGQHDESHVEYGSQELMLLSSDVKPANLMGPDELKVIQERMEAGSGTDQ